MQQRVMPSLKGDDDDREKLAGENIPRGVSSLLLFKIIWKRLPTSKIPSSKEEDISKVLFLLLELFFHWKY